MSAQPQTEPDTYEEVRDDLDTLTGDIEAASRLMSFIAMRETETEGNNLSPDFVGALFSVQTLLDAFRQRGNEMVHRMMALEPGRAVRS